MKGKGVLISATPCLGNKVFMCMYLLIFRMLVHKWSLQLLSGSDGLRLCSFLKFLNMARNIFFLVIFFLFAKACVSENTIFYGCSAQIVIDWQGILRAGFLMTQLIIHLFQSRPENESPHWRFHIITATTKASHNMLGGERTGLVVRALDSGSGDPGSILGRVGVLFP